MDQTVYAADMFAGAGGSSTGLANACRTLGKPVELVALNHWKVALETHQKNHPWARHILADVQTLKPRDVIPRGKLNLLIASPTCIFFSNARGGRPVNDQQRSSPWLLLDWIEELRVDSMLVENVKEIVNWAPLGTDDRPLKSGKGKIFNQWIEAIRAHNYTVDWKVLNSADYGDATSRQRFFLIARRGLGKPIWFPKPTHSEGGKVPGTLPWRAAKDVLDLSLKGRSIFGRDRPIAPNTIARIIEGIRRFCGKEFEPFLILMEHSGRVRSIGKPLPTITTARGGAMAVCEPFLLPPEGIYRKNAPRKLTRPVPTITQRGGDHVVEPVIVTTDRPETNRSKPRSIHEPLPTIVAGLERIAVAQPFLTKYCSTGGAYSINDPAPTLTTHDRLALVQPEINGQRLEILMRMLTPLEMSRAMSFPESYEFVGTRSQVIKQIGNAVSVRVAQALCTTLLGGQSIHTMDAYTIPP